MRLRKDRNGTDRTAEADHQDSQTGGDAFSGFIPYIHPYFRPSTHEAAREGSSSLEVVDRDEPITAWRAVKLMAAGNSVFLQPLNSSMSLSVAEAKATCYRSPYEIYLSLGPVKRQHPEPAPHPDCECGFYGVTEPSLIPSPTGVTAEVEFYGTVIEHEIGYRAEYQRILALALGKVCEWGFLCDSAPEFMAFRKKDGFGFPCCAEHAEGKKRLATPGKLASRLGTEVRFG